MVYHQLFHLLEPKQADAIKRAKTLLKNFENVQLEKAESSSTVHLLVHEQNKYK